MFKENNTESLSKEDFARLSSFIYRQSGIKMPESKKIMVEARLRKRLKELKISSYNEYCNFIFSKTDNAAEITNMVDVITTNKTDFFREPKQFTLLSEHALANLIELYGSGIDHPINIWSAGCSTGEEPYTISIVLHEFARKFPKYNFKILATDISTRVLQKAQLGVYDEDRIAPIPEDLLKRYFLKSKDRTKGLVRTTSTLRNSVKFQWLNFMEEEFGIKEKFEIIFCRNVIIYFDKKTQEDLIEKLISYLLPGGYLMLGHSESIFNANLPLVQIAPSTYKKIK